MASKSRTRPERKKGKPNPLAEMGLFDIPNLDSLDNDDESEVDESTLESELEALLSGKVPTKPKRPKPKAAPAVDIERLAADCLKDDDDDGDDDGDLSNDEDLLNELHTITSVEEDASDTPQNICERKSSKLNTPQETDSVTVLLKERLTMYNDAIEAAKLNNDSSKVRRYGRAVKTLETLLKSARAGAAINEEDIPPEVKFSKAATAVSTNTSTDSSAALNTSEGTESKPQTENSNQYQRQASENKDINNISELCSRRDQYKKAALVAKKDGDKTLALKYLKTVKNFDSVIEAIKNNLPVDLSNIPPPTDDFSRGSVTTTTNHNLERITHDEVQSSSSYEEAALAAAASDAGQSEVFSAPPPPSTILEALQQRLEKYTATKQAAEVEGNSGKVRRLQRIIKQYESAIKDHKSGKGVNFEELPCPPGFSPIPVFEGKQSTTALPQPKKEERLPDERKISKSPINDKEKTSGHAPVASNTAPPKRPKVQRTNTSTVGDKQLEFLLERQKLFRQAALAAKQNGDIQQAKEYLRMSKGFDSMIEATRCGLPIDASTIPTPPQLESDFEIVDVAECIENDDRSQEELYEILEKDLSRQIEICTKNKEHFLRLGDVSSVSKFEKLLLESRKDLAVIQHLKKKGEPAPRLFHYETRVFSIVQCHTELSDNDIAVFVERGINLPGKPDELDSYIKIEFPIPSEAPQRAKTHTIRDTNNPVFKEEFKFEFNRKSRSQLRQFKRQALKLDVWSKGGFLRSDTHLGTVSVKLADLESKCSVHDSFDLMDGRRACGGKIEVKVRIRDPLLVKQVEEVREKWLVVGS